jgi:hypothetical protein
VCVTDDAATTVYEPARAVDVVQAAGIAAALSVRTGLPFHELDAGLVQAELDRQGVRHQ